MKKTIACFALSTTMIGAHASNCSRLYERGSYDHYTCRTTYNLNLTKSYNYNTPGSFGNLTFNAIKFGADFVPGAGVVVDWILPENNEGTFADIMSYKMAKEWIEQANFAIDDNGVSKEELLENLKVVEQAFKFNHDFNANPKTKRMLEYAVFSLLNKVIVKTNDNQFKINKHLYDKIESASMSDENIKKMFTEFPKSEEFKKLINKRIQQALSQTLMTKIGKDPTVNALRNELKEQQKLLTENPNDERTKGNIRDAQNKIAEKVKELESSFDHKAFQSSIQQSKYGVTILTSLLHIVDPREAQKINVLAQSTLDIASLTSKIAEAGSAGASLGPYAGIAVAALNIFKALGSQGKSPDQMIMEQIQELSRQLESFRQEVHGRFDRIEDILGAYHKDLVHRLANLHYDINEVQSLQRFSQNYLRETSQKIDHISRKLDVVAREEYKKDFNNFLSQCLKSRRFFLDREAALFKDHHDKCVVDIFNWTATHSFSESLTGVEKYGSRAALYLDLKNNRNNYNNVIVPLMSYAYERGFISEYYSLANPTAWVRGAEAYMTLREANTIYKDNTDPYGEIYDAIEIIGEEINYFSSEVRSEKLFNSLFDSYINAHNGIFKELEQSMHKNLNQSYLNSYAQGLSETISKLEGEIKSLEDEKEKLETSIANRVNSAISAGACTPGDDIGCSRPAPGQIARPRGTNRAELEGARSRLKDVEAALNSKKPELNNKRTELETLKKQSPKERFDALSKKAFESEDNAYRSHLIEAYAIALDEVNQKTLDANDIDFNRELIQAYSYFGLSSEYYSNFDVRSALFGKERIKSRKEVLLKLSENQSTAEGVAKFYEVKDELEKQINTQKLAIIQVIQNTEEETGFSIVQPTLDRLEKFKEEFHPFL